MLDLERLSRELVACIHRYDDGELYLGTDGDEKLAALQSCLHEIESDRIKSEDFIEESRIVYHCDDITVPPQPIVSIADDGAVWVMAWVRTAPDQQDEEPDQ
jgi:hypothetical protein